MIDMHSHILPNVDDGSKSIEETKNMLEEAKKVGFTAIVSTTHYIEGYYDSSVEERKKYLEEIEKENPVPKIYLGNEMYLSENIVNIIKEGKASSINKSQYILFEMPFHTKPLGLKNMIYDIMQNNYIPILAHPERYDFVQQNPELIYELIQMGVFMQANYGSIIGQYGTKAQIIVKYLLKNNMIHFLGTDVHRQDTIYPQIPKILSELKMLIGDEKVERITNQNPKLVLENKKIEKEEVILTKLSFKDKLKLKLK